MRIEIAQRFRPFSHCAGIRLCVPGSDLAVRVFPTRLERYSLASAEEQLVSVEELPVQGPVKGFTVIQDLERGEVKLLGTTPEGRRHQELVQGTPPPAERLSLGCHKKQDWQLVCRRQDVREFLPIWFCLGLSLPRVDTDWDAPSMLKACAERIKQRQCDKIAESFTQLFQAGFQDLMFPTLEDRLYQGFSLPPAVAASPLALLSEGAALIRSLFFQDKRDSLALLPALPPEAFSGRLINTPFSLGTADIEWSKKQARCARLQVKSAGEISLKLQRDIRRFRLRRSPRDRGEFLDRDARFEVFIDEIILIDRFEK